MTQAVVFDTKPYDREALQRASGQVLHDDDLARLPTFPNVLITAHQAFLTHDALSEIGRVTAANIHAFQTGTPFLPETALT